MFDTEMCDKIKCLKQTFLILYSPKNRDYRSKLGEKLNFNSGSNSDSSQLEESNE